MQVRDECFRCGSTRNLEVHHVFFGNANRKLSDKYGLTVKLCPYCHRGMNGVHNNHGFDLKLKEFGQECFEASHPRLSFLKIFGKNYKGV